MEVASAAISPLGFGLDPMEHKVLMRMHIGEANKYLRVLGLGYKKHTCVQEQLCFISGFENIQLCKVECVLSMQGVQMEGQNWDQAGST
jgi:hypothetical protein